MTRRSIAVFLAACVLITTPSFGQRARPMRLPEGTQAKYDLPYIKGGGRAQSLDLFIPRNDGHPLPLVVWVHGGGWRGGDKARCLALPLIEKGYAVASINYRLSGEAPFPAQIHDCKAAIRWLRANAKEYSIDPDRIGVWGGSAGGHLVALLGTAGDAKELEGDGGNVDVSSRVRAVCDFYGPSDLPNIGNADNAQNAVSGLLGGPVSANLEKAKQASPITYITPDDPPFLIIHGARDRLVPASQSQTLYERLKEKGVEAKLEVIESAGHGGPEFTSPDRLRMIVEFFDRHLKQAKP